MDAKYVREHVGDALARACVLVAQFQPDDPIEWIACFLRHDAKQQAISQARKQEALDREKLLEEVEQEEERLAKQKVRSILAGYVTLWSCVGVRTTNCSSFLIICIHVVSE